MSLRSYAVSKNIFDSREIFKPRVEIFTDEILMDHIDTMSDLHQRLRGCPVPVNNMTNKMVEDFKISKIFLEKDLERFKISYRNRFEYEAGNFGDGMLTRIETILNIINQSSYDDIVLRSVNIKEISIYNVATNHISMGENFKIYVKSIDDFCENIIEYDYIKFLTKLKRMGKKIDFMKTCAYICSREGLEVNSYNFILACVSFPYEFVRVISKYRDLGSHFSNYQSKIKFDDVIEKDGESFV